MSGTPMDDILETIFEYYDRPKYRPSKKFTAFLKRSGQKHSPFLKHLDGIMKARKNREELFWGNFNLPRDACAPAASITVKGALLKIEVALITSICV